MKSTTLFATILFILISNFIYSQKTEQEITVLEKIANAHGFQNWKNINELKFTFNVDRDTMHFERSWVWKPKTNDITSVTAKETIQYNWSSMDSVAYKTNAGFINDKFWLLIPFQLMWDVDNINYEENQSIAPISQKSMQKLTIVYGNEGGYTPGDAYDLYFEEDFIIKEWVFRKSNQKEPSTTTTFEDYKVINGLNLAQVFKTADKNFKLYFTEVIAK